MKETFLHHFSISNLQLHRKNPRRWCLEYIEGLKSPPSPALALGKQTHAFIEESLYRGDSSQSASNLSDLSKKTLQNFVSELKEELKEKLYFVESKFSLSLAEDLPPIVGAIDLITKSGNINFVMDHKTCHPKYKETDKTLKQNWQLGLYSHVVGGEIVKIRHNQLLKNAKNDIFSYTYVENILTENEIRNIMESIKEEMYLAKQTWNIYKKEGILSVRETLENRVWYGNPDPLWEVICGKQTVEEYKKL